MLLPQPQYLMAYLQQERLLDAYEILSIPDAP